MKKFRFAVLITLFALILYSPNYAQSICPIKTLKITNIKGRVSWNDKFQEPIKQTKVELISFGERESFVASALTDNSGYFEINNIKSGRYALEVWATVDGKSYFKYRLALKVKKSTETQNGDLILVKLGGDCFSSEVNILR